MGVCTSREEVDVILSGGKPLVQIIACSYILQSTNKNIFSEEFVSFRKMDKYTRIVQNLLAARIKLVAVDFDLTILNVHTRGAWQFTSKMLATRVRPCFQQFLTVAVNSDLHVAVVTQSPQVSLIQEVLEQALPDCDTGRIVIRGADGSWKMLKGVSKEGT